MRKETDVVINDEGRDKGKTFHLTEMGAAPLEDWALKVLCAVKRADPDLDLDITAGIGGLVEPVIKSLFKGDFYMIKSILDEMMTCVKIKPDPKHPDFVRPLIPGDNGDIEEMTTRLFLKREVFRLHTGF